MSSDKNTTNKQKETDKEKLAKEAGEAVVHKLDVFEEDDLFEEFEEGIL